MTEVACIGDLFLECIVPFPPASHPTTIVGSECAVLGGNAYTICWNFAQLGLRCALLAPFARCRGPLIYRSFLDSKQRRGIVWTDGDSDLLVAFVAPDRHCSLYLKGDLPRATVGRISRSARRFEWVILAGSRHDTLRRAFVQLARLRRRPALVFTPSYTVFEYERDDLTVLLDRVTLAILNESEARYAGEVLGVTTPRALARRMQGTLIVTYADRGAVAYIASEVLPIESVSSREGDVVGAGDAFLAAYLHTLWTDAPPAQALRFAAVTAAAVADAGTVRVRLDLRKIAGQVAHHPWGFPQVSRRPPEDPIT